MEEGTYYVGRNALYPWVITMGDVIDLTLMHINKRERTRNARERNNEA